MFALDRGSERRRKLEKSEESDVQMVQKVFRDGNQGLYVFTEVTLNLNSKDLLLSAACWDDTCQVFQMTASVCEHRKCKNNECVFESCRG